MSEKVVLLRPEARTSIDLINDALESLDKKPSSSNESKPIKFMGTFDEDPYIATLAAQYKAFMDRRKIRVYGTKLESRELTFEDYLCVRGEMI